MAWTRKSSAPHFAAIAAKTESIEATLSTSHGSTSSEPSNSASGRTRRPSASP